MKGRSLRIVVLVAWVVAVWSVALPALASGPLCDDRGASRVAPSPVLIVVPDTLDVDSSARACDQADAQLPTYGRHRAPPEPEASPDAFALPSAVVSLDRAFVALLLVDPNPPLGAMSPGVRARVERPPRA